MTTNLILQGLTTQRSDIDRIAALAGGRRIVALAHQAYRVEDVQFSEAIKASID